MKTAFHIEMCRCGHDFCKNSPQRHPRFSSEGRKKPMYKKLEILFHAQELKENANLLSDKQFQNAAKEFSLFTLFQS